MENNQMLTLALTLASPAIVHLQPIPFVSTEMYVSK